MSKRAFEDDDKILIAKLRQDLAQVDEERRLALKHCHRYRQMLETTDECVWCEACEELWFESSLGDGVNPPFCKVCHEFWCRDCVPEGGCGCPDKRG
jgi:hypothetical protein